jgi:hypothetical protein
MKAATIDTSTVRRAVVSVRKQETLVVSFLIEDKHSQAPFYRKQDTFADDSLP